VAPLQGIPLAGQGKPLPLDFSHKGQWLLENRIFLYRSKSTQTFSGPELTFTASCPSPDGEGCFGFDATQLALAFQISSEQIFEHNRAHTLFLVSDDDVPATQGFVAAKLYIFQIGDYQAAVTVERGRRGGKA
jgi:hypothetical protein